MIRKRRIRSKCAASSDKKINLIFCKKSVDKSKDLMYTNKAVERERQVGSLAQLGEHLPYKQRVTGSSPVVPTKNMAP